MVSRKVTAFVRFAEAVYGKRWQSQLARASGLSQSFLSMIASEERALTPEAVEAALRGVEADAAAREKRAVEMREIVKEWEERLTKS